MAYVFLSPEWFAETQKLRDSFGPSVAVSVSLKMNMTVTEAPFSDEPVSAHLDSSTGAIALAQGHLPEPDVSITSGYEVAKSLLLGGDPTAAMQAMMSGQVTIQGDLAKLFAFQATTPSDADSVLSKIAAAIREATI